MYTGHYSPDLGFYLKDTERNTIILLNEITSIKLKDIHTYSYLYRHYTTHEEFIATLNK